MTTSRISARADLDLADAGVIVDVNGHRLLGLVREGREGADGLSSFGLLAGALSSCTASSVHTFLDRWQLDSTRVHVEVAVELGRPPVMHRQVSVTAAMGVELREQLAAMVDSTPMTVLLGGSVTILTQIRTEATSPPDAADLDRAE